MSLSSAMNTAQAIFNNTGTQTSTVSKNMANSGNADYAKRTTIVSTTLFGAQVSTTVRAQNEVLMRQNLGAISQNSGQQSVLSALGDMRSVMGGTDYEMSPAKYLEALRNKIHEYATRPSDQVVGAGVISAAQDTVTALNTASSEVQRIRADADKQIEAQVDKLNNLLAEFKVANDMVTTETAVGGNPNDALDRRDSLLKQISEIVGVSVVNREHNDVVLYTSDGTTLFETSPRKITFERKLFYDASTAGNAIYIDGVAVDASTSANTTALGSLPALLQVRDEIAPTFQAQLDEVARGLITIFAESENATPANKAPGLFTWTGYTTTMPAAGTVIPGLAASIRVSSVAAATPSLVRDGGINGAAYTKNPDNNSSFSTVLDQYDQAFDTSMAFDASAGIDVQKTLIGYSSNSLSWLESLRSSATAAGESKTALLARSTEAYSNMTGVSLDEELSLMLDLEQSYKAATKLVSAIDEMLQALLNIAS